MLTSVRQQSIKTRNITIQKGPLSLPFSERSYDTPSFRIVDFGRAVMHREVLGELRGKWLRDDTISELGPLVEALEEAEFKDLARGDLKDVFSRSFGILDCIDRRCFCCIRENVEKPSCTSGYLYHLKLA